jgi:hypothetical protein
MNRRPALLCFSFLVQSLTAAAPESDVTAVVSRAGNADRDEDRLAILEEFNASLPPSSPYKAETENSIAEIRRWIEDKNLPYFSRQILDKDDYDFGVEEDSPLYPLANLYRARMLLWVTLEYGGYWNKPEKRRERFESIRPLFERAAADFPENRIVKMYLGKPLPPEKSYEFPDNAPAWAVYQREGLERLTDIVHWWIDNRLQEDGQYGGGWGDDCEMWRWWTPVLIGFQDPKIEAAQEKLSKALLSQDHMAGGYTDHVFDVEHTSEDSSDVITPMMHLAPNDEYWTARALRLADVMENLWTGINERGHLQFKSTYFSVDKVDPDPRKACDTVYHPRAVQPALLYWQRTGDKDLGQLFAAWMDTWVEATAREERGKPAGIVPSAIHWPDGGIGGVGENWWNPENHSNDPLYVWPSAMGQMTATLLQTFHMTHDEKYLEPLRSMAQARLEYLSDPPEGEPVEGTKAWAASKIRLTDVAGKFKLLTGRNDFDPLLEQDPDPYLMYRLTGEKGSLERQLRENAEALSVNFPGYTSEVRYTDRVLRFPHIFGENGIVPEGQAPIKVPEPQSLYATATGDPGDALYFPLNAVRWLTPPRNIAALVDDSGKDRLSARVYNFAEEDREIACELFLLEPGEYRFRAEVTHSAASWRPFTVGATPAKLEFGVPSKSEIRLIVKKRGG